jgi:glycosyltransferase involved in cell wall biosynthesis
MESVREAWFHRLKFYVDRLFLRRSDLGLRKWFLRRVDRVITVSDGLRGIYVQAGLISAARSRTIYNIPPIDAAVSDALRMSRIRRMFCICEDRAGSGNEQEWARHVRARYGLPDGAVVLTVGKMSFGKGTDVLLRAVPKVLDVLPGTTFVFVGRENPLIIVPDELKDRVRMLGVLDHEEVMALYAVANVVTVPSVWPEPLSRVLLETMSVGKPVVATRVGGTPEVVEDGRNGLLVAGGDPVGLAEAIICLLRDPGMQQRMGEQGRELLSERLDPSRLIEEYVAFVRDASDGGHKTAGR